MNRSVCLVRFLKRFISFFTSPYNDQHILKTIVAIIIKINNLSVFILTLLNWCRSETIHIFDFKYLLIYVNVLCMIFTHTESIKGKKGTSEF